MISWMFDLCGWVGHKRPIGMQLVGQGYFEYLPGWWGRTKIRRYNLWTYQCKRCYDQCYYREYT